MSHLSNSLINPHFPYVKALLFSIDSSFSTSYLTLHHHALLTLHNSLTNPHLLYVKALLCPTHRT